MKRTVTVFSLAFAVMIPWMASAQEGYRWTDKQGKEHITAKPPKQEDVTPQEWDRLQKQMETSKAGAAADSESLPALAPGTFLKWKDKNGSEHYTNAPPKHAEVSDAEWERLKTDITKMNDMAAAKPTEVPKPAETPAAASGEKLPQLPPGKTLLWTGKDGKRHMTSEPPNQDQVSAQDWEKLKKDINDMIEEAKNAPPPSAAPPPAEEKPAEMKPEGEKKPGEIKPEGEKKPGEIKPEGDKKPEGGDAKPMDEKKPEGDKPEGDKPAGQ